MGRVSSHPPGAPLLLALVALLAPASVGAQHFPTGEDLELMARYLVEDGEAPGVVLGVREADGSTRVVAHGSAGPDAGPLGPRTIFEIGSITKTFTATLLAQMALRGEVDLKDPVEAHLPEGVSVPSRGGREITLLNLATHRSGLPNVPGDMGTPGREPPSWEYTVEDAYAFLSGHELRREPGARYEYSNFGYGLLAHALSRAAGVSYPELVRTRILEPLDMGGTGFASELEGELPDRMARGHRESDPVRHRADWEIMEGAGGLRSNAVDLLRYIEAQLGPPETELEQAMRMAHEVRVPAGEEGAGYGLAWSTLAFPGEGPVVHQSGGTVGFSARISFLPESGIGTVVLANDARFGDPIGLHLLYPDPPPADWKQEPPAEDVLARYAGEYRSPSGESEYFVRLEDEGFLTYQPDGQVRARLYSRSDSSFYLLRAPWSFTFRRSRGGDVRMAMEVDEREPGQRGAGRIAEKVSEDTPPPAVVAGNAPFHAAWGTGTWLLVGLAATVGLGLALRPLWSVTGPGAVGAERR